MALNCFCHQSVFSHKRVILSEFRKPILPEKGGTMRSDGGDGPQKVVHGLGDMKTLSETLGHYSAEFTLSTYTHATAEISAV